MVRILRLHVALPIFLLASTVLVTPPIPVRQLRDTSRSGTHCFSFLASFVCVCLEQILATVTIQGARRTLLQFFQSRDDEHCQSSQCVTRPHLDALTTHPLKIWGRDRGDSKAFWCHWRCPRDRLANAIPIRHVCDLML